MGHLKTPLIRNVFLALLGILVFASFRDSGKIRYFQSATLIEEADTVVGFPSTTEGIPDTLFQVRSASGLPIAYYKKVYTGVCFDNECRMLDMVLYWNITGRYLGFELPQGEFLSKFDHEPFTESEYERLHGLLADMLSPLGMFAYNELAPKPLVEEEEIDGMTSATSKDILEYVVEGAAFTTYTLRKLVYGPIRDEVESHTRRELSEELVLKILESPDVSDKIWALTELRDHLEFTPALRDAVFDYIDDRNYSLAERAIHSINRDELESDTFQLLLLEKFYQTDYGLQKLILDKLKEAPQLGNKVRADLAENLKKWEGALLSNVLDLYIAQKAFDIETCRLVSELLQNDNRYISQKAFNFLENSGQNDESIDRELETYKMASNSTSP